MYPIIGAGTLPFRGGCNPQYVEDFLEQYEGIKTFTVQSAFRYDFPKNVVKSAIKKIQKAGENPKKLKFSDHDFSLLKQIIPLFEKPYTKTIEKAADFVNELALSVPKRRERVQHIGLFGYNRGVGKTKLPRAITYTAAWYSIGIPPEFIGLGRGLHKLKKQKLLSLLEKHFISLRVEISDAGRYLNWENLINLAEQFSWAKEILEDINLAQEILGMEFGPKTPEDFLHRNLTSNIFLKKTLQQDFSEDLIKAAKIRSSLG